MILMYLYDYIPAAWHYTPFIAGSRARELFGIAFMHFDLFYTVIITKLLAIRFTARRYASYASSCVCP